ncbi:WbuC family cupin fold metalloprotein [Cronobacter turicensis]|uniref:WbuC family cupin fold metalloprotein n=1 Tax=Cronobacter turicensis TaxID=413502 RepID=UPI0024AF96B4|nr:WbuC family cupin fold metalloprotein [Cronobacter turicensis]ELY2743333.1 WbuC family cupin fold metalloprotein [Cronobacter turicensis]ELY2785580.1 WbuC family cupin fold metalloprotein [Cronobacter turicensis]ELY4856089.1 WbuC family cupin fold metalloprotein [Cronobacter turicensis]ELY5828435.1 WbuC family cupin fold metalloprotein [Cronobacter turicensis]MDI7404882.1 WbuC family cupin fold metalloprotein [Cronobacter turicensis]
MRLIETSQFDLLFEQAKDSERLRSHLLLHNSHQDKVQRLLIAMVRGSYVEPHYHELPQQWEMFTILQGQIQVTLFNIKGEILTQFLAGEGTGVCIVELSPGDIHSVECISEKAIMMEIKEGPFDPAYAKAFPHW